MDHDTNARVTGDMPFDKLVEACDNALALARRLLRERNELAAELVKLRAELAEARQTIEDLAIGTTIDHSQHTD